MDYEITSTRLIIPDSVYEWLCEQEYEYRQHYMKLLFYERIGWLYRHPKYTQEYLKKSKQALFKGED